MQLRTLRQLKDFQDNLPAGLVTQSTSAYPVRGGKRERPLTTAVMWSWPQSKPEPAKTWLFTRPCSQLTEPSRLPSPAGSVCYPGCSIQGAI